ncbi:MAG: hypothetical protein L0G49_00855 [Luteococcus sp.]|uniref:hypothetical protein n=1 Tax=Luteococcus sp. TaxID=1969402 RepID=UPI0026494C89|nr:hypothetical protein [Luteococcus sp.]MDN5562322.1 hypothetical protein [Luteococcus sp.]
MEQLSRLRVSLSQINAERKKAGSVQQIETEHKVASRSRDDRLQYRIKTEVKALDADGELVAAFGFVHVASLERREGAEVEPRWFRQEFQPEAVAMVLPYIREVLDSSARRLGLSRVSLPLMRPKDIRAAQRSGTPHTRDDVQHGEEPEEAAG